MNREMRHAINIDKASHTLSHGRVMTSKDKEEPCHYANAGHFPWPVTVRSAFAVTVSNNGRTGGDAAAQVPLPGARVAAGPLHEPVGLLDGVLEVLSQSTLDEKRSICGGCSERPKCHHRAGKTGVCTSTAC